MIALGHSTSNSKDGTNIMVHGKFSRALSTVLAVAGFCAVAQAQPDVIVGELHNTAAYTTGSTVIIEDGIRYKAFAVGTTSCNIGNVNLDWIQNSNQHPVIPQALYRLKDGRLQQVGMSWLKHGFCALQLTACNPCGAQPGQCPCQGGCLSRLAPGCSDPYDAGLNGDQGNLGPRWEVNASTGAFAWPFSTRFQTGNAVYKRLKVKEDDVNPNLNVGALYFAEGMYIHPDDAAAGNSANNASYRRVNIGTQYTMLLQGSTERTKPAILAWQDHGLGVNMPDPDVIANPVDVGGDGRFWVAYKVSDNGDGTYHYEYAIQNLTSHRSGGYFSIPLPSGVNVTNAGFYAPFYHSGEPYSNDPWTITINSNSIVWASPEDHATNPDSNALRFGTMYNFWFDADTPPTDTDVVATLGLFRPGSPEGVPAFVRAPSEGAGGCPGDLDGDSDTDFDDMVILLGSYGVNANGDLDGDNDTDFDDLFILLSDYGC